MRIQRQRWRAPETFTREYAKFKDEFEVQKTADVYSLGMLLWQLRTLKRPFATYDESKVVQLLTMGTREVVDPSWPKFFKDLLNDCWSVNHMDRPSVDTLIQRLFEMLENKEFIDENGDEISLQDVERAQLLPLWQVRNVRDPGIPIDQPKTGQQKNFIFPKNVPDNYVPPKS